jgi:predicted RecB family endonuclease
VRYPLRSPSADYLEEAALEDLTASLERRGYRVVREALLGDQQLDLLAERNGERIGFEVKARSRLKDSALEIERLRTAARHAGLTGFRVVIATPPHAVDVTIEGLDTELLGHLYAHEMPDVLAVLSAGTRVEDVSDIEIEAVEVRHAGIRVLGRAYADIELTYGSGAEQDALTASDSVPFSFDLELDSDLKIATMHRLTFDTSAFVAP